MFALEINLAIWGGEEEEEEIKEKLKVVVSSRRGSIKLEED